MKPLNLFITLFTALLLFTATSLFAEDYTWTQIHNESCKSFATGDFDGGGPTEVMIDFGEHRGIYVWDGDNADPWRQVNPTTSKSITMGDFDGDGKDEAMIDFGSEWGIWIWDGDNQEPWKFVNPTPSIHFSPGDFDGDSKDEVMIDFGSEWGIWIWDGDNQEPWKFVNPTPSNHLSTADFDGDGKDEAMIDFGSEWGIWIWDGDNQEPWKFINPTPSVHFSTGDFDGDGKDEAMIDFGSEWGIWMYDGNTPELWKSVNPTPSNHLSTGDFDGDGRDEALIDFGDQYGVYIWKYYPQNTFSMVCLHPQSPDKMARIDFDGDGHDEAIMDFGQSGVFTWDPDNAAPWQYIHELSPESIVPLDFDGDGKDEAIFDYGQDGTHAWDSANQCPWEMVHSGNPDEMVSADLDGDGIDEVIFDYGGYGVFTWDPDNAAPWQYMHELSPESIISADFDGDGKDEAIFDYGEYGTYTWDPQNEYPWQKINYESPDEMVSADLDGDGIDEVIFDYGGYGVFTWDPDNAEPWQYIHELSPESIISADFDGDGRDEGVFDYGGSGVFTWDRDNTYPWIPLSGLNPEYMINCDVDGDGKDEIMIDFGQYGLWLAVDMTPHILSASPKCSPDGYVLSINGTNFSYNKSKYSYAMLDDSVKAKSISWSDKNVECKVAFDSVSVGEHTVKIITAIGESNGVDLTLPVPLNAPSNLSVLSVSSTKIDLAWQDNSEGEDGFKIEISDDGASTFRLIGQTASGTSAFCAVNLASHKNYSFRVYAYSQASCSPYSNTVSVCTTALLPPTIDAVESPTCLTIPILSGSKDIYTSILINGCENIPLDCLPTWAVSVLLAEGLNTLNVAAMDGGGMQSESATVDIFLDTTPPGMPVVTDDGGSTTIPDRLNAVWFTQDNETGIAEYRYAVGTAEGLSDILPWTSTDTATSVTATGLNLTAGHTYYISVMARSGAGLWSGPGSSDGITLMQTAPSINGFMPAEGSVFEAGTAVNFNITAVDGEQDSIQYKVKADDETVSDWSDSAACEWQTASQSPGAKQATIYVRDVWGNESLKNVSIYIARKTIELPQQPQ